MKSRSSAFTLPSGFTLLELLLVVAIVAIVSAIAMPLYQGYVASARQGIMADNMQTMRLLQEGMRLSGRSYQAGSYDPDDPDHADGLTAKIGWSPNTSVDEITYVVVLNDNATAFTITATHRDGTVVQKTYAR